MMCLVCLSVCVSDFVCVCIDCVYWFVLVCAFVLRDVCVCLSRRV